MAKFIPKNRKGAFFVAVFILTFVVVFLAMEKIKEPVFRPDFFYPQTPTIKTPEAVYFPSKVLDLSGWKLTLPVFSSDSSSLPLDISQPQLENFEMTPWFQATPDGKGVVFRAPVDAPTTNNSSYPRSELREMESGGTEESFWSSVSGTHSLFLDEAITAVPQNKPDVVAGQIHGDDDDLITIRLEGNKLFVARSKQNLATLDDNYSLGRRFTIKFVARDGNISIYYNGGSEPVYVLEKKVNKAYFKAGVYTQSNCQTEVSPDLCTADNYGEVVIYQAIVSHANS